MSWFRVKTRTASSTPLRSGLSLILGALLIGAMLTACAGTPDNGTTKENLATFAARATEDATVPEPPASADGTPGTVDLSAAGKQIADSNGCTGCHSIDGSASAGPTWQGLFGHEVTYNGGTVTADEAYITESIRDPSAKIVEGFADIMPKAYASFTDEQIASIIAYIQTLE